VHPEFCSFEIELMSTTAELGFSRGVELVSGESAVRAETRATLVA
jgi:hypothetical protein